MTKTEYAEYLQSEHWQSFRKQCLDGASCECERCEIPRWLAEIAYDQDLHLHHKNYACLGKETWEDIEILCRRCHELETFGRSDLRMPKRARCHQCGMQHFDTRSDLCKTCDDVFNSPWLWWVTNTDFEHDEDVALRSLEVFMKKRCGR